MTEAQLQARIQRLVKSIFARARLMLPRDTGNLQDNAFQLHHTEKWQWTITVELEIAPYFIFVNETPPFPRSAKELANKEVWQRVVAFVTQEFERGVANIQRQINTRTR